MLLEKASKIRVDELDQRFNLFVAKEDFGDYQDLKTQIEEQHVKMINQLKDKILEFDKNSKNRISNIIQNIAKDSRDQILKSLGGKPVEPEELRSLLKLKADREDILQINQKKAEKTDVKTTNSIIEILHNQINHICLILREYFRFKSDSDLMPK